MAANKRTLINVIIAATAFAAANEEEHRKKKKWTKEWIKRKERGSNQSIFNQLRTEESRDLDY